MGSPRRVHGESREPLWRNYEAIMSTAWRQHGGIVEDWIYHGETIESP